MPWHVLACPSTPCYELDKGLMKGAMVLLAIEPLMYLCTSGTKKMDVIVKVVFDYRVA